MKDPYSLQTAAQQQALNDKYLNLLNICRKYNANGHKLKCFYMCAGRKYNNELLVILHQPPFLPEEFLPEEINNRGVDYIFDSKILHPPDLGFIVSSSSIHNLYFNCIREVLFGLGICKQSYHWQDYFALTCLYKLAYCIRDTIPQKTKDMQIEFCRQMLPLEVSILQPKRVLFLTGMYYAKEFLNLPGNPVLTNYICSLGQYDYGGHKAQTVIAINPHCQHRYILVPLILNAFKK